jgi:maleate cis-trans isomerase
MSGEPIAGWRCKLGFLVPPGTPTVEREMPQLAPRGVSVHFNRLIARGPVGTWDTLQQRAASHVEHIDLCVEMLASVGPAVIVLAHTATSYFLGRAAETQLAERLQKQFGVPFISALGSVVEACRQLGVKRLAVGTGYDEALTLRGKASLEAYDIEIASAICLAHVRSIFDETPERVFGLARAANHPHADAVFLSGVGLPTLEVVAALETDLGKPVISSATAMMWNALRIAGVRDPVPGYGRLLSDPTLR